MAEQAEQEATMNTDAKDDDPVTAARRKRDEAMASAGSRNSHARRRSRRRAPTPRSTRYDVEGARKRRDEAAGERVAHSTIREAPDATNARGRTHTRRALHPP